MNIVDNLLLLHNLKQGWSSIYDIKKMNNISLIEKFKINYHAATEEISIFQSLSGINQDEDTFYKEKINLLEGKYAYDNNTK